MHPPTAWIALGFALLSSALAHSTGGVRHAEASEWEGETAQVAEQHLRHVLERDYDAMAETLADDFTFVDPTAEIYPPEGWGAAATGVQGREAALQLMHSWDLPAMELDRRGAFVSGAHAVVWGDLRLLDPPGQAAFPVVFVLTVREGRITARRDYGDYVGLTRRVERGEELAPEVSRLVATARDYWSAYGARRFEEWTRLHGEGVVFQDETLEIFGADSAQPIHGSPAVVGWFDGALNTEDTLSTELEADSTLWAPHHAVLFATYRYRRTGESLAVDADEVTLEFPIIVALTIRDGAVVEHRDFWAAESYAAQIREARATGSASANGGPE